MTMTSPSQQQRRSRGMAIAWVLGQHSAELLALAEALQGGRSCMERAEVDRLLLRRFSRSVTALLALTDGRGVP